MSKSSGRKPLWIFLVIALMAAGSIAIVAARQSQGPSGGDDVPIQERANAFAKSEQAAATMSDDWPQTEEELIREFWLAASQKNYERLALLCPGSVESDFKEHYDKWTPGEASAIGIPEPHPTIKGVTLFPVKVPFPGYTNKTVKMAVMRTSEGRLGIDGQNTIWW